MQKIGAFLGRYGAKLMITGLVCLLVGTALHGVVLSSENLAYIRQAAGAGSGPQATVGINKLGTMVYVPAATFVMGSSTDSDLYDRPAHRVKLPGFWIRKYPVTNLEYKRFLDATGYPAPPGWNGKNFPAGEAFWPVTNVSWYDAESYARWAGQALPSEAQWELAARGTQAFTYPWGNRWVGNNIWVGQHANIEYAVGHATPVGVYPLGVSPYGLYDMAGNVWEWTGSDFKPYPGNAGANWTFYKWKDFKVTRGGSYMSDVLSARAYQRNPVLPTAREPYIGFRTVSNTPPGS